MTLIVMMILLPIQTGSIETGWFSLRQTGISQCGFAILPLRVSLNDFDSFGEEGEAYPKGRHRNAKHSAATTLQPPLLFDALEWRSMVEFRPGRRPTARLYDFRGNYYDFRVSPLKINTLTIAEIAPM